MHEKWQYNYIQLLKKIAFRHSLAHYIPISAGRVHGVYWDGLMCRLLGPWCYITHNIMYVISYHI